MERLELQRRLLCLSETSKKLDNRDHSDNNRKQHSDFKSASRTSRAFYVSIACEVLGAETDAGVRRGLALSVEAALGCQAGVHAFPV